MFYMSKTTHRRLVSLRVCMGFGGRHVELFGTLSILYYNTFSIILKLITLQPQSWFMSLKYFVYVVDSWLGKDVGQCEYMLLNFVFVRLDKNIYRQCSGSLLWIRNAVNSL